MGTASPDTGIITNFNQLDPTKKYSYADYLKWQFDEYVELIKGRIFKKMSPAPLRKHQKVVTTLSREFGVFLKNSPCDIYVSPFDVRFPKNETENKKIYTVVQPDITVVCDKTKLDDKGCIGAPDMIVEVISKSSSIMDWNFKFNLYQENNVKEYWIAEPISKVLTVFVLDEENKYKQIAAYEEEAMISSSVLNGFSISWNEVFED